LKKILYNKLLSCFRFDIKSLTFDSDEDEAGIKQSTNTGKIKTRQISFVI